MRFSLLTLIVATMAAPPLIAAAWWYPVATLVVLALFAILPIPTQKQENTPPNPGG